MDKYGNKLRLIQICPGTEFQKYFRLLFSGPVHSIPFLLYNFAAIYRVYEKIFSLLSDIAAMHMY